MINITFLPEDKGGNAPLHFTNVVKHVRQMMVVAVVVGILMLFKRCKGDSGNPHHLVWGQQGISPHMAMPD